MTRPFAFAVAAVWVSIGAFASLAGAAETGLKVRLAQFQKLERVDSGTIHALVENLGGPATISDVRLNGRPVLTQQAPSSEALWARARPAKLRRGEVAHVEVKLARRNRRSVLRLAVLTDAGARVECPVALLSAHQRLGRVTFSRDLRQVYVYVENAGKKPWRIEGLRVNGQDLSAEARVWPVAAPAGGRALVTAKLRRPFKPGQAAAVWVWGQGRAAAGSVRAFHLFPITHERADQKDAYPGKFLDASAGVLLIGPQKCPADAAPSRGGQKKAQDTLAKFRANARSVLGSLQTTQSAICYTYVCPTHQAPTLADSAGAILARQAVVEQLDPTRPTLVHICRSRLQLGCRFFGPLTDAPRVNPIQASSRIAKTLDRYRALATQPKSRKKVPAFIERTVIQEIIRQAAAGAGPTPLTATVPVGEYRPYFDKRPTTPEEVRLMAYMCVGSGLRGVAWRTWSKSLPAPLCESVDRVCAELQVLKPYLAVAYPWSVGRSSDPNADVRCLLAGDRAMVAVVLNQACATGWNGSAKSFGAKPLRNLQLSVPVPSGLKVKQVFEVGGSWRPVPFEAKDNVVSFKVAQLDTTRQYVLASDANAYERDSDRDGVSDVREASADGTHPHVHAAKTR